MKLLKLTYIVLLCTNIYAQSPVQIDMHGGKDIKKPFHMTTQTTKSMYELLHPHTKKKDTNQTAESK